jgi:hypothetical protein
MILILITIFAFEALNIYQKKIVNIDEIKLVDLSIKFYILKSHVIIWKD